jgi:hypothetical protein
MSWGDIFTVVGLVVAIGESLYSKVKGRKKATRVVTAVEKAKAGYAKARTRIPEVEEALDEIEALHKKYGSSRGGTGPASR